MGNLNPFRYRGYFYDTESGLYYLQSRYYDPTTGRFVNADGLIQTGNGLGDKNMFAYCGNNPIMNADPTGEYSVSFRAAEYREYLNEGYSSGAASAEVNERYPADPLPSKHPHAASKVSKKKGSSAGSNSLDRTGKPNSKVRKPDGSQEREYDENGRAKTDTDYGHADHHPELDSPHQHDWTWDEYGNSKRGPAYNISLTDKVIAGSAVVGISLLMAAVAADDVTGIGAADDAAEVPLSIMLCESASKAFG
ncbi:MAG: RHS repeat-associated core domain-containing protein [Bacillota bacterium]|nr:RHS repeat-associated core domain-containing protein [Bacillota bacterium]